MGLMFNSIERQVRDEQEEKLREKQASCAHRWRVTGTDMIGYCHCEYCGKTTDVGDVLDAILDKAQPK